MTMSDTKKTPVAIVGGGPVGLALALFLDRYDVPSVVFNTDTETRWHPKGLDAERAHDGALPPRSVSRRSCALLGLPADYSGRRRLFHALQRLRTGAAENAVGRAEGTLGRNAPTSSINIRSRCCAPTRCISRHSCSTTCASAPNITLRFGWEVKAYHAGYRMASRCRQKASPMAAARAWRANISSAATAAARSCAASSAFAMAARTRCSRLISAAACSRAQHSGCRHFYRDILGNRQAFQHWAVNPQSRATIIALDGREEFLFWMRPKDSSVTPDSETVQHAMTLLLRRGDSGRGHRHTTMDRRYRAGGGAVRGWPRFACRRCGASVHADRRVRHEYRHRRCREPVMETGRCAAGLGRSQSAGELREPNGCRSQSAIPAQRAQLAKSIGDVTASPEMEDDSESRVQRRGAISANTFRHSEMNSGRSACSLALATMDRQSSSTTGHPLQMILPITRHRLYRVDAPSRLDRIGPRRGGF